MKTLEYVCTLTAQYWQLRKDCGITRTVDWNINHSKPSGKYRHQLPQHL